jgi:NAD(P)-dependent dehydrogenase (short-subunit alcohol dehydrogenase family)
MNGKTVLLTGGAGGLGRSTARYLAEKGWHVFAADFNKEALAALQGLDGITPVYLDVTDPSSLLKVRETVEQQTSGLDGLVNFAGILAMGSMIEMDEDVLGRVLDINVVGTYRTNRTFFSLVLKRKGRIVVMSSETGWQSGGPFNGAYAMSKHALEAYADSLRRELMFLDVPVIKIQPGPFRTAMVSGIEEQVRAAKEASTYFGGILQKMEALVVQEYEKANDPVLLAQVVYQALTTDQPKAAYSVKPDPQRKFMELLPTRLADRLMRKALGP